MTVAFDAYYAFHYKTGVAHYSRNLINGIATAFPDCRLLLFTDVTTALYQPRFSNVEIKTVGYEIPFFEWVSSSGLQQLIHTHTFDVYHGLDHALPENVSAKTVVSIHDLFFVSSPHLYAEEAVRYYCREARKSASVADQIVAISAFTKNEIIQQYRINSNRIEVVYQSCNNVFFQDVNEAQLKEVKQKYNLPEKFWLYVGSITERKGLLQIVKALQMLQPDCAIPLVVVGEGDSYLNEVKAYIQRHDLADGVYFVSYTDIAKHSPSFQNAAEIPLFYRNAFALLYPSLMEGFGIPVVEAFASGIPIITSNTSSLPEIGGDAALYVDPLSSASIADAMSRIFSDEGLRTELIANGKKRLTEFLPEHFARTQMAVYEKLLG